MTLAGISLVNGSARAGACGGSEPCALAADGGCVLLAGADSKLSDCVLSSCAAEGRGGAIFVGKRGGVGVAAAGVVTLNVVHLFRCLATYCGAIWAGEAVSLGAGTRLQLCTAFQGGGVFVQGPSGSLTAARVVVEGCRATAAGGGVHATLNASVHLEGVAVRSNAAGAHGGGMYIEEGGELVVDGDSVIQNNSVRTRNCAKQK